MKRTVDYLQIIKEKGITSEKKLRYAIDKLEEFFKNNDNILSVVDIEEEPKNFFEFFIDDIKFKIGVTHISRSFSDGTIYFWY